MCGKILILHYDDLLLTKGANINENISCYIIISYY